MQSSPSFDIRVTLGFCKYEKYIFVVKIKMWIFLSPRRAWRQLNVPPLGGDDINTLPATPPHAQSDINIYTIQAGCITYYDNYNCSVLTSQLWKRTYSYNGREREFDHLTITRYRTDRGTEIFWRREELKTKIYQLINEWWFILII